MKKVHNHELLFVGAVVLLTAIASSGLLGVCNAQTICNVPYAGLMACKPSVTPPNPPPPTANCCSALSHADLHCLCSYKSSSVLPSLGIDPNLAMQLPAKCNLPHAPTC
uniref:Lipid binding protein n=1 Tax=Rhizophora mucronata TaxID=61149 RepID=A0A2P2NFQ4_RHIMU